MPTIDGTRRGAKSLHANGIDIAYTEVGAGPPLVLLHGGLVSTGPAWAGSPVAHVDHLATLGRHFRVIAPDTRGAGGTVHPGGPATFDVLADDVAALIEVLDLGRPMVAGFSEGGATATITALRHPEAVGAVVNHGGFDYFDPQRPVPAGVRQVFGGGPDATAADPDAAERMFLAVPPMADVFTRMQRDYDGAQGAGHWRTYLGLFFDRHVAPLPYTLGDLAVISVPTLILTGDRDDFCSVELACHAYRSSPTAELAVVPSTGHEISSATIDAMVGFLLRHAGAA